VSASEVATMGLDNGNGAKLAELTLREFLDVGGEELCNLLHLGGFSEGKRILYIDAQIANRALDLRVTKQDLDST
jgi:hypothetical protein